MPIDLKWVRSDPEKVKEWQSLRGRDESIVDAVLQKDEVSRSHLRVLQDSKRELQKVKKHLRPNGDQGNDEERSLILNQKALLESQIAEAEERWKTSKNATHRDLCRLASPVGRQEHGSERVWTKNRTSKSFFVSSADITTVPSANEVLRAWNQYTRAYFENYLWVESPNDILSISPEESPLCSLGFISFPRALELWGVCCETNEFCNNSSENREKKHAFTKGLPSWIEVLEESLPSKTIWGDKELPRYTALWSRFQGSNRIPEGCWLDLLALTAASVVDAKEVQTEFVDQLCHYYESLCDTFSKLNIIIVPSKDLHQHEWSRIEIWWGQFRLGWVSHWGDAITRACEMAFSGGGVQKKKSAKDYVHLVQARVIDESTWTAVQTLPDVLAPAPFRAPSKTTPDWVLRTRQKPKNKTVVFGTRTKSNRPIATDSHDGNAISIGYNDENNSSAPKFPPMHRSNTAETTREWEQSSCPFDFVFQ